LPLAPTPYRDREDVLDDLPEQGMPEQAGQEFPHTLVGLNAVEERGEGGRLGVQVVRGNRDLW
jgi:hypothetical protein